MPRITSSNDSVTISDFIAWSPHVFNIGKFQVKIDLDFNMTNLLFTGTTMLINTYDNRLHICVSIDKALIENYNDVQEIADNVLKYLDLLEEKI